jgi:hypothetical protein
MGANRTEIFNVTRLVAPVTYLLKSGDDMIDVDTSSGGATTIYVPNIVQNGLNLVGKTYTINDVSNNASNGNITIICLFKICVLRWLWIKPIYLRFFSICVTKKRKKRYMKYLKITKLVN